MEKEWRRQSKNGKRFVHAGFGRQDAVGAEKPSDAIPIQDGIRLFAAKGIDVIWKLILAKHAVKRVLRRKKSKRKR